MEHYMRFPNRLPVDKPPLVRGERVDGRRTPIYVLAWVCNDRDFFKNLGGGVMGKVNSSNFAEVVSKKWEPCPGATNALAPLAYPGAENNSYLIAMFNFRETDHIARSRNASEDLAIEAARVAMGVDQDASLESTLQWFRWPLYWIDAEVRQRELAEDRQADRLL